MYFAERESQIMLGDLGAVNCTGWVEGFTKLNVMISSILNDSAPRLQQEELEGERE